MKIEKLETEKLIDIASSSRPDSFDNFVGQEHIKSVLKTWIASSKHRWEPMWHILLCWSSGFGKTTIANIIAKQSNVNIKAITWYAINKPAEIITVLNSLEKGDILFIDEIHRLKPNVEEVLYIAMEDFVIDMVMPDGSNVRVPLEEFTLIGATTKSESLTTPLKNRFVYDFHLMDYNDEEKIKIIKKYLDLWGIDYSDWILDDIRKNVSSTPREIYNFAIKLRDFLIVENNKIMNLDVVVWEDFIKHHKIEEWGISPIQQKYLEVLSEYDRPIWIKTISTHLWINEKAIEEDIEPLLIKLWKVEKTVKGRIIL